MRYRLSAVLILPMLFAGGAATLSASPATALQRYVVCSVVTFYNDATHDEVVGSRRHCTNGVTQSTGRATRYMSADTYTDQLYPNPPSPRAGGGVVACHFLVSDCPEWPAPTNVPLGDELRRVSHPNGGQSTERNVLR